MGQHNIHFYHQMMREVRESILEDRFLALYREKRELLQVDDIDHPITNPRPAPPPVARVGDYELYVSEGEPVGIRHGVTGQHVATTATVETAHLPRRLRLAEGMNPEDATPLIVWDIGLGAGAAALAAILIYEEEAGQGPVRPMHLVSFTDDLSPLRLALSQKKHFEYLRHGAADTLVHRGEWKSRYRAGLSWSLRQGPVEVMMREESRSPDVTLEIADEHSPMLRSMA